MKLNESEFIRDIIHNNIPAEQQEFVMNQMQSLADGEIGADDFLNSLSTSFDQTTTLKLGLFGFVAQMVIDGLKVTPTEFDQFMKTAQTRFDQKSERSVSDDLPSDLPGSGILPGSSHIFF